MTLSPRADLVALSSVVRVIGPVCRADQARHRRSVDCRFVRTRASGEPPDGGACRSRWTATVFRGPQLVSGGSRDDARGFLETKREIKELRERIRVERDELVHLAEETAGLEAAIATASQAHRRPQRRAPPAGKGGGRLRSAAAACQRRGDRLALKGEQLARERRQAEEERDALDRRQDEARASIVRLQDEQQGADERLTLAQRRLFEAREATEDLSRRAAEARARTSRAWSSAPPPWLPRCSGSKKRPPSSRPGPAPRRRARRDAPQGRRAPGGHRGRRGSARSPT